MVDYRTEEIESLVNSQILTFLGNKLMTPEDTSTQNLQQEVDTNNSSVSPSMSYSPGR